MIDLQLIPFNTEMPSEARPRVQRVIRPSFGQRRQFLKASVFTAASASLYLFSRAIPVRAGDYDIEPLTSTTCYQTSFYATNGSCDLCGPSTSYSTACNVTSGIIGYHRSTGVWLLRPGQCNATNTTWDGWLWKGPSTVCCSACRGGNCNVSKGPTVRCHDGKKCDINLANCVSSICEYRTATGITSQCPV